MISDMEEFELKQEIERLNLALNMEVGNRDHFEEQINLIASLLGLDEEESERTSSNDLGDRCRERASAIVDERDRLIQVCNESNEVCTCGCPMSDHDYDEDGGPCCGEYDHDCVPTCLSTLKILTRLRAENEHLKQKAVMQEICYTCGGDPESHASGVECVCKDGTRDGETSGLRMLSIRLSGELYDAMNKIDNVTADRDKYRSMAVKLRAVAVDAYNLILGVPVSKPMMNDCKLRALLADTAGLEGK